MNGNADLVNALANDSSKDDEPEWNYEPFIIGTLRIFMTLAISVDNA
jgi:hypothetical protein